MNKICILTAMLVSILGLNAQTGPDIRLHSNIFEKDGPTNSFTLVLGAAPGHAGYADVVCSGGNQSEAEVKTAYYDSATGALVGTGISCQVNEEGIVEVYCDDGVIIDYISCTGAELTSIEVKNPENINVLALEHNILESLDLTPYTSLQALYLRDNPFDKSPLIVGKNKPDLTIIDVSIVGNLDPAFDISSYHNLMSFDAMNTYSLKSLNPSGCPGLKKLSIDNTNVASLDLSNNRELLILNISESRIPEIDLSHCPHLQQFYATHLSSINSDIKLKQLDVTGNPELIYLFATSNDLTALDVSKCPYLEDLYVSNNRLTSLNLDNNKWLTNVFIANNCMDFNTLPLPQDSWVSYDYVQRPIEVPQSNLAGTPIDLSAKVRRDDSNTIAAVFTESQNSPGIYTEVPETAYTFDGGVLTFNEVIPDSVFVSFFNGLYPEANLQTTHFKVKDEKTYGQDDKVVTVNTTLTAGAAIKMHIGIQGASEADPKTFYVDLGNGTKQEFKATSAATPSDANVDVTKPSFGAITVYVPEGERLTAFKVCDIKISSIDLSPCHQLSELTLKNTKLKKLDLQWNRALTYLELTGNDLNDGFTLAGANGSYSKNVLTHIVLSDNNMSNVKLNEPGAWRYIDLSHNGLTSFDFTDADSLAYLDVSHNAFEYLKVNYCEGMRTLLCNDNKLNNIVLPETNNITYLDCSNNCFTLATMPDRNNIDHTNFIYAPQAPIAIPTKGPGYNLSEQYVEIEGFTTQFIWMTDDGSVLTEGVDYTCIDGRTRFDDRTIGKTLYCILKHDALPALSGDNALRTTPILSAGMPTHLLGTFTTPTGGQEVRLSVASAVPNNALYIDWTDTQSLEQYPLMTTYRVYSPVTTAGAHVKVWSYEEDDNLTVFSLTGASLSDVDLSPMRHLINLTLNDAGIETLVMPQSAGLRELALDNNKFSSFAFGDYPQLEFISLANNLLTEVDLSGADKLQQINLGNNQIAKVTLAGNTSLWSLGLPSNNISEISLDGAPNLYQLFLNYNKLSSVDVSNLSQLKVLYLDHNEFDFSTLPLPREAWALYTYGGQKDLNIKDGSEVDLSHLAQRDGTPTVFTWFYGYPDIDESTGEISGETLYVDDEYTIEDGITRFLTEIDRACCVLTNPLFPGMYMITNVISASPTSVKSVDSDPGLSVTVIGRTVTVRTASDDYISIMTPDGKCIAGYPTSGNVAQFDLPASGIYILVAKGGVAKIAANN